MKLFLADIQMFWYDPYQPGVGMYEMPPAGFTALAHVPPSLVYRGVKVIDALGFGHNPRVRVQSTDFDKQYNDFIKGATFYLSLFGSRTIGVGTVIE